MERRDRVRWRGEIEGGSVRVGRELRYALNTNCCVGVYYI